ncbi:MAG TPA: Rap1a/Tai family immunity protein, partial [Methylobacter sp.]
SWNYANNRPLIYCSPDTVTVRQMTAVILKKTEQEPERWQIPFITLATEALQGAFPCSSPNVTGSVK